MKVILSCCTLFLFAANLVGQTAATTADQAHRRAEELLRQMTIEEKVGQMNQSSGVVMPLLADEKPDNLIVQGKVGSILWLIDVKETIASSTWLSTSRAFIFPSSSHSTSFTDIAPSSRSPWPWPLHGIQPLKKPRNTSQARTRAQRASAGPLPPWSTSPAIPAGGAS